VGRGLAILGVPRCVFVSPLLPHKADRQPPFASFQQGFLHTAYSPVREQINCKWYIDGRDAFAAMYHAILGAKHTIFITDWRLTGMSALNVFWSAVYYSGVLLTLKRGIHQVRSISCARHRLRTVTGWTNF
jgi:phosphatidylserine/phosphatidylglycerophosphate/cardiolipin synthase-like enzyme